jgi:hypothetical protein
LLGGNPIGLGAEQSAKECTCIIEAAFSREQAEAGRFGPVSNEFRVMGKRFSLLTELLAHGAYLADAIQRTAVASARTSASK